MSKYQDAGLDDLQRFSTIDTTYQHVDEAGHPVTSRSLDLASARAQHSSGSVQRSTIPSMAFIVRPLGRNRDKGEREGRRVLLSHPVIPTSSTFISSLLNYPISWKKKGLPINDQWAMWCLNRINGNNGTKGMPCRLPSMLHNH